MVTCVALTLLGELPDAVRNILTSIAFGVLELRIDDGSLHLGEVVKQEDAKFS